MMKAIDISQLIVMKDVHKMFQKHKFRVPNNIYWNLSFGKFDFLFFKIKMCVMTK